MKAEPPTWGLFDALCRNHRSLTSIKRFYAYSALRPSTTPKALSLSNIHRLWLNHRWLAYTYFFSSLWPRRFLSLALCTAQTESFHLIYCNQRSQFSLAKALFQSSFFSETAFTWRTISRITPGFAEISLAVGETEQHKGFKRPIFAIDPKVVDRTTERVTQAFEGHKMVPEDWKNKTAGIVIT